MSAPKTDSGFWESLDLTLTAEQRAAIGHVQGPLLVVAGPGSGKTTVITYRAAYLMQVAGISPDALLVLTFSRDAADSLKSRTAAAAGGQVASRITFGTFHALAYRILRQADPSRRLRILSEEEQLQLIRQLMRRGGLNADDETLLSTLADIARMRAADGTAGADGTPGASGPPFCPGSMSAADFATLWKGYGEAKAQHGVLDFDDLLHQALGLLRERADLLAALHRRYRYLMVDEVQDTNAVQWALIRLLAASAQNLCAVGDDDQAIYGWRGASPHFLLEFGQEYPAARRINLEVNHRCPSPVVTAANRLAGHNRLRFGKLIRPVKPDGEPVQVLTATDTLHEAEQILQLIRRPGSNPGDWAIIYRTNQQAHALAQVLDRAGVPYRALGGLPNLYKRWPVQDLFCYLRAAAGDASALTQVVNRPNRFVSRAVLGQAERLMARSRLDLLAAIAQTGALRSWQLRPLEELSDHLRRLAPMTAPEAIGYVRRMIGYDEYVSEYAARQGGSPEEIFGLLTEVERTAPRLLLGPFLAEVERFTGRSSNQVEPGTSAVTLATCHRAKGLEFPCVVVAGATDRLMPHRSSTDLEEERRLMYVAMTRAAAQLWFSIPGGFEGREAQPSPFVAEALGDLPAAAVLTAKVL